jgi:hypothetical protein
MAFLRHASERTGQAARIRPIIERALARSGETSILDLCSGGAGPLLSIANELTQRGQLVSVSMTDINPSAGAQTMLPAARSAVRYEPEPIDAREVPDQAEGLRTIINAFHHFVPADAQRILASAVAGRRPIAAIEVVRRSPWTALAILGTPFHVLLVLPFLRPFRPAWLPLTYLLPVVPIAIFWDAFVSCLRAYSREELLAMTRGADPADSFEWTVEEPKLTGPIRGIALTGIPRERLGDSRREPPRAR